ncbi:AMP nucleosidase [Marinitoga hydrogenitolerans DSM 16785]|uniref:AMP nucleosidase n=1 Tax=Marinitoga hydrogenitolerans (strain DSM 16785 / JCM 12826 / AT1271) TaxID=1122195 RepID=A0A1M5A233_MARH1|nr:hypothetical protein [Marinitoga hydrogenitolerans]SHF24321.1 AMP nucleosidase [Marinitoga hydrogenitolerans DSM 16785]
MKIKCGIILENISWYNKVKELFNSNPDYELKEITLYYDYQKIIKIRYKDTHEFYIIIGSGASNAASNAEFLINFNINLLLRIGTVGALTNTLKVGDVINIIAGIKGEGVTKYYLPEQIPAMANIKLFKSLGSYLESRMTIVDGIVFTTAARFKENIEELKKMVQYNVIGIEMETAAIFGVGLDRGIPAGALCIVSDSPINDQYDRPGIMNKKSYSIVEGKFQQLFLEVINWTNSVEGNNFN